MKPRLLVIIASTRPGRMGLPISDWFVQHAREHEAFDVHVADLAELGLPFMDEPYQPRLRKYQHQHTMAWSACVDAAEAFVFITPEYNAGLNAPLKNALDYLVHEWADKPVAFVSYGGVSAGTGAVHMLRQVVTHLRMVPVYEAVNIPFVQRFFDDTGSLTPNEIMTSSASALLNELARVHALMRPSNVV